MTCMFASRKHTPVPPPRQPLPTSTHGRTHLSSHTPPHVPLTQPPVHSTNVIGCPPRTSCFVPSPSKVLFHFFKTRLALAFCVPVLSDDNVKVRTRQPLLAIPWRSSVRTPRFHCWDQVRSLVRELEILRAVRCGQKKEKKKKRKENQCLPYVQFQ